MANPFYVQPALATPQAQQGLASLGQALVDRAQMQQAQKRREEMTQAARNAFSSNDPNQIAEFSIQFPEMAQTVMNQVQFRNDRTRQNFIDSQRQIAAGANPETVLQSRLNVIRTEGGDPTQIQQELAILQQVGPERYREIVTNTYAALDPEGFKSMGGALGKPTSDFAPTVSAPQTGADGQQYIVYTDRNTGKVRNIPVIGGKVETGDEKMNREIRKKMILDATDVAKDSFGRLQTVRNSISLYDDAIKELEAGANTGVVDRFIPSIQENTIRLENIANKLGLNVISSVTFGALSEAEMKKAMDTAIPMGLEPAELKVWLQEQKEAQQKLAKELLKMSVTLGRGKKTVAEYLSENNYIELPQTQASEQTVADEAILAEYGVN